jgi:NADPH:quinone reductase
MKTNAIRFDTPGGPEVLRLESVEVPAPGPGQALVRHAAIGVNFIDTYHRSGLYPLPAYPSGLGQEAAGVVEAVGDGVTDLRVGQRIAYAGGPVGAYAGLRLLPADRLVPLPDAVPFEVAAAMMLKGMTAEYLLRRTIPVKAGDTVLVHAAAGGVGLILCQWAKALGVRVIGTVGTDAKAALAAARGCDVPIVYTREEFVARVKAETGGEGVAAVYDGVGKDTFLKSLDCLRPRGLMALFGQASGKVDAFDPGLLAARGSLFLTRPSLFTYTAKRSDLLESAGALFGVVQSGAVRVEVTGRYPLADAARAHRDLESRATTGSVVLEP